MWKPSYAIGVDQLDQQHKQLVLTLEDLLDCLHNENSNVEKVCKQTMDFTKNFVVVHFSAEEMYQQSIGYPGREAHKKMHDEFAEKLRDLEFDLMRANYNREAAQNLAETLTRWWVWHIVKEDRKMMQYIPE